MPPPPAEPDVASALSYLHGRLCDRLDRIDDARRSFERSRRQSPGFLPGTIGLAELYVRRCRWHKAIRVLDAARAGAKVDG